ncbi:hypothetical protein TNCT_169391 [Trichonephila clavata]|uniref:Uncharacterized protein n=1 Tax=Trichonephila clavata TaxID=2740835 RepID=A0A8X6IJP0_TRICU|nr:hypothetical protein TNCT_169391 [Trichonephila clavata]
MLYICSSNSMSDNKIVQKNIKMPLIKAFVCQTFGFVLYNYLSDPLLEAKILPENIANPVLAAVIAFLCFLLQVYTDNSDDLDDYETSPPRRSRHRKTSDKTEASDFMGSNRFSRTGVPEPTFFRMDVRDTVMSGSNIDELIYKMAAVERVLEQTAQSARANTVFAMPDIISVEREVYTTRQDAAETETDVDATKPDIIAAEIHVEIASTGAIVDEKEEEEEQSEVQSKENEDDEKEIEETEEEEPEVKSDSVQDACEEEEEENEAKSDSAQEEEEEDEVTVIDALNKSKEKYTDKSEDASTKNGDSRKKKGMKTTAEKETDYEVKPAIHVTTAPETNEDKPTNETPTPVEVTQSVSVTSAERETVATSLDVSHDSSTEEVEVLSSKMVEMSSTSEMNDIPILEEISALVTETDESTVMSDSNANVPITIGYETISILSESVNKEADEKEWDQPELSSVQQNNTVSSMHGTLKVIDKTNDATAASESLANMEDAASKVVENSLDKVDIKNCPVDEVTNVAQMRKPVNGEVEVAESLNMTMIKQESHNKVIDDPKSIEPKAILNGVITNPILLTDDIQHTISTTRGATDSERKNEVILNGIMPDQESFVDEEIQEILNQDLEQSNIADSNISEADSCDEGMITQSKSEELVLEKMNVPAVNGIIPKSSDEVNSKSNTSESLNDTPTETLSALDNITKEADVMKLPIHTKINEDNNVPLSDNSTLHDGMNNLSTSNEKVIEETKDAIESNSSFMEVSTKEDNSTSIVMKTEATEETHVDIDNAAFRQEALPSTVIKSDEKEIDITESMVTVDERALLTEIETSKPEKEASTISEDVSKIQSIPETEIDVGEMMYLEKQFPVDVSFLYTCFPQNNSCDNCIVLNSKMDYVFKFLET